MPSFLEELLKRVKYEAAYGWSLKKAAEFVGYSPFHLSRTFKAFMGYGFPEFVDRARVELAIKYLSESVHSVDQVATLCGYCSTHGLREAMKQYVGFLPSEIRMLYPLAAFG
jgi:AraC-like DNA-binding protein